MLLRDLRHVKTLLESVPGAMVGVGITAFPRIVPSSFLDSYSIVALRKTSDLPILRKRAEIFCLEEAEEGGEGDIFNSAQLLAHRLTREYLGSLPGPKHLLLYQNYPLLEDLARRMGWRLLANPSGLRLRLGDREFFLRMGRTLGLPLAPGGIWPVEAVRHRGYGEWASLLGEGLVFQLPDIAQGGGRGTFFVRSGRDYDRLVERLMGGTWRGTRLGRVYVSRFVDGAPASVALSITRDGILISGLQEQLVDLPYCAHFPEDGVFCGHSWGGNRWSRAVEEEARGQAETVGRYLASLGYRGILGIDFIVEERGERVVPIEINPRFTGAFPMLSLLHMEMGIVPLDIFHMLEFMEIPYSVDPACINGEYARPLRGSHLLLFCPKGENKERRLRLRPGLYRRPRGANGFLFVRDADGYRDLEDDDQFVLIDGPPSYDSLAGKTVDPLSRLCHVLFPFPAAESGGGLCRKARMALNWIYGEGSGSYIRQPGPGKSRLLQWGPLSEYRKRPTAS